MEINVLYGFFILIDMDDLYGEGIIQTNDIIQKLYQIIS